MNSIAVALPPVVDADLRRRGVVLDALPAESEDDLRDRLDTELMALFRDTGRREAFEALYEHSRVRVFTWLRWLMRGSPSPLDPLDLLQDTFVNVYRYAAGFRSERAGSFRAWVRTIAANVIRRARQAAGVRWLSAGDDGLQQLVDLGSGPQLRLVQGEETERLRTTWMLFLQHYAAAFESLSPRDRRALTLVEVEGLSYAETGRRLGVGPSNMKMIMLRARRRLAARMRATLCIGHAALRGALDRSRRASA